MLNVTPVKKCIFMLFMFFSDNVLGKHVDSSSTSIIFDGPVSVMEQNVVMSVSFSLFTGTCASFTFNNGRVFSVLGYSTT